MTTALNQVVDTGGTGDYTSLSNWEAQNLNLTGLDKYCICDCKCTDGNADTNNCLVSGWNTDVTRFIKVWCDPAGSYRHAGKYVTGNKYRIEITDASGFNISNLGFCQVDGIQIQMTRVGTTDAWGLSTSHWLDGQVNKISNCIVKGNGASSGNYRAGILLAGGTIRVWNCIVYGFSVGSNSWGIRAACSGGNDVQIYNCTVFGCTTGYLSDGTNVGVVIKNCAVANNTDDFNGLHSETVDYCASDDGDGTHAVDWTSEATDWANIFTDYANGDFSLKNYTGTGKVIGVGVDNPGSGLYSDDIIGIARSSTWDIGAFEYVATGTSISVTDTGLASDSIGSIGVRFTIAEAGHGAETMPIRAAIPTIDIGHGTDSSTIRASISIVDVGNGSESIQLLQALLKTITDIGSGNESLHIATNFILSDLGHGTDVISLIQALVKTINDYSSGTDSLNILNRLTLSEAGYGNDSPTINVSLQISDIASGLDSIFALILKAVADAANGSDSLSVTVRIPITDIGVGTESITLAALLRLLEYGHGVDSFQVTRVGEGLIATITFGIKKPTSTFAIKKPSGDFLIKKRRVSFKIIH
jgi:hypothetical protein